MTSRNPELTMVREDDETIPYREDQMRLRLFNPPENHLTAAERFWGNYEMLCNVARFVGSYTDHCPISMTDKKYWMRSFTR